MEKNKKKTEDGSSVCSSWLYVDPQHSYRPRKQLVCTMELITGFKFVMADILCLDMELKLGSQVGGRGSFS